MSPPTSTPPPPHQPPRPHHPPPQQPPHQPPPPPQPQYYPYPYPHPYPRPKSSSKTFCSCILATLFLGFIILAGLITCFILFHPQDPIISISSIKLQSFTLLSPNANFTILQLVSIRNPNRFSFSHHGSSFQLISSSAGSIGFMYIPAGLITAGGTKYLSATFDVKSFNVGSGAQSGSVVGPGPTMELETRVKLVGSVKVLEVFAHHVEKSVRCRVSVKASDGSLLGYHC